MMKRFLTIALLALTLALVCTLFALGETYQGAVPAEFAEAFSGSRWAGYQVAAGYTFYPAGNNSGEGVPAFFVMKKGDENVLCILEYRSGAWKFMVQSPKPIYQGNRVPVFEDEDDYNWFSLFYRDQNPDERGKEDVLNFFRDNKGVWRFLGRAQHDFGKRDTVIINALATDGEWTPGALYVTKRVAGRTVYEAKPVYGVYETDLRYFSLSAFPKSLEDAREKLSNPPEIPAGELSARRVRFTSGQKFPVYSGPGEHYLRSAGGRAIVSTNDWIQVFGVENGWAMIQYDISSDHMRIGFIEASALPKNAQVAALALGNQPMTTHAAVTLTDDPLFSKAVLAQLPQGQQVRKLSAMGTWAYVEAELAGGPVRGFVPAISLASPVPVIPAGEYSVRGEFAAYAATAVMNRSADGTKRVITVYVDAPAGAQGTDLLIGYQLYENNRPGPMLSATAAPQGLLAYAVTVANDPSVTVLGLTPRYSQSGERPGEALVMIIK
jgi:hypothetical protein